MAETKTVYFLGAGASAASDFKLPVMQGFFREEDFTNKYSYLNKYLNDDLYPGINKAEINLEEVIPHLELTLEGFNWGFVDSSLLEVKKELYGYIQDRLNKDLIYDKICSKHKKIIDLLNLKKDSIISLNYDLIVDNILNRKNKDEYTEAKDQYTRNDDIFNFIASHNATVQENTLGNSFCSYRLLPEMTLAFYIKLHGSLNWYYCPNPGCLNNTKFFIPEKQEDVQGIPCLHCGTSLEFAIIPPSMKKSFEKFPKMGFLWHLAFNELKAADRIVSIGMSLPDSDYYLKWLIKQAMIERTTRPELIIVNLCSGHREKIAKVFGVNIDNAKEYNSLDEYIKTIENQVDVSVCPHTETVKGNVTP